MGYKHIWLSEYVMSKDILPKGLRGFLEKFGFAKFRKIPLTDKKSTHIPSLRCDR